MKGRILIADNHEMICTMIQDFLEKEGYETRIAYEGIEALKTAESFKPDIFILDLVMPNISGDQLSRIIRNKKEYRDSIIIIISGIAKESTFDFISAGANACVAKSPVNEMQKIILSVIKRIKEGEAVIPGILGTENIYKRQVTKELLEARNHFQNVLQNLTVGILEVNSSFFVVYANDEAKRIFSMTSEELLGRRLNRLLDDEAFRLIQELHRENPAALKLKTENSPLVINSRLYSINSFALNYYDEREVAILIFTDITGHKEDHRRIQKALAEKELLFKEIHHRVKNNLTMIESIISLEFSDKNEEYRNIMQTLLARLRSIGLIHEKLYKTGNFRHINFRNYSSVLLENLISLLAGYDQEACFFNEMEEIHLDTDTAITAGLIITELATNTLKYAKKPETELQITLKMEKLEPNFYKLIYRDNGPGLPEAYDIEKSSSLGMKLVKTLTEQIKGTLNCYTDDGAVFEISFHDEIQ